MRIGHFHTDLPQPGRKPGGVSIAVHRLAQVQARRDHEVTVWSFDSAPEDRLYEHVRLDHHVDPTSRVHRMFRVPWVLNEVPFGAAEVLHLHGDDWFFRRRDLPTVRTLYGSAWHEARTAPGLRRQAFQTVHAGLEILSSRLATRTYGLGPGVPAAFRTVGTLDLGTHLEPVEAAMAAMPTVAFVGTWHGRKRGALLYEVFHAQVLPALPDARLVMVSDRCVHGPNVTCLRDPTNADVRRTLAAAHVFCLPSTYEGFGLPYLEAMSVGCPVVATDNPGSRHVLGTPPAGRIVADADLGAALLEVLRNPDLQRELGAAGLARAEHFSWSRVADDHQSAYGSAIRAFHGRP